MFYFTARVKRICAVAKPAPIPAFIFGDRIRRTYPMKDAAGENVAMGLVIRPFITACVKSLLVLALICISVHAQTLADRADALLAKWDHKDEPGMAVLLIRNGRIEYRKGFGLADVDAHTPITPNTQFLLASVTKQFTAMAIMILAEQRKLQFDDTLAKFCPEFPGYAQTITIRNLLNHTAGLTEYSELLVGKVDDEKYFRSSKSPPAAHEFTAAEALQALSRQQTLRFSPGDKFEYSNSGYVVLGQIIERVTGKRYAEFLKETIFDPLGMHDTLVVDERKQKVPQLALGYGKRNGQWQDITYTPENHIYGEDDVVSTVNDLYKWDQALYTERLVRRSMLEMAFTPGRTNNGKEIKAPFLDRRPTSYGFGWFIGSLDGNQTIEHGGAWSGYRTYILRVPSRRVTAIVLTNSSNDEASEIAQGMVEITIRR
jgi:CubicO group peptidase (beta-lactamase class C family)